MATKGDKKPTEKSASAADGDNQPNVKDALSDTVAIIAGQVKILKRKALEGRLDWEDARLLSMYSRALVAISNDERHAASILQHDLGQVDNDELERQYEEALKVVGGKK